MGHRMTFDYGPIGLGPILGCPIFPSLCLHCGPCAEYVSSSGDIPGEVLRVDVLVTHRSNGISFISCVQEEL